MATPKVLFKDRDHMKIVFFLEGESVPASRFRVRQFDEALQRAGIEPRYLTTKPSKYLALPSWCKSWCGKNSPFAFFRVPILAAELSWVTAQRLVQIVRFVPGADVVVLQRDLLFRIGTPFLELFIAKLFRGRAIVFDVDDAIYLDRNGAVSGVLERKLSAICSNASHTLAGNKHLVRYFERFGRCELVPTVIDTDRFAPRTAGAENALPVICWTGSGSNLDYLVPLEGALNEIARTKPFTFRIVADAGSVSPFSSPEFFVELRAWSRETEVEDVATSDIGIMPLPDDEWSKGKCGFKLLQYMAVGLPSVASPIGANSEIVLHGESGLLASTTDEWMSCIARLLSDPDLRRTLGATARKRVVENYSVHSLSERWVQLVSGKN